MKMEVLANENGGVVYLLRRADCISAPTKWSIMPNSIRSGRDQDRGADQ